jgi:hypothetical protein
MGTMPSRDLDFWFGFATITAISLGTDIYEVLLLAGKRTKRLPVSAPFQFCLLPGSGYWLVVGANGGFRPVAELLDAAQVMQ